MDIIIEERLLNERIRVQASRLDEGINVLITGGSRTHIGAVSFVSGGMKVMTTQFPGHKDGVISERWALRLSDEFEGTVCVECGIHYDNLDKAGIQNVVAVSDKMLNELLRILCQ